MRDLRAFGREARIRELLDHCRGFATELDLDNKPSGEGQVPFWIPGGQHIRDLLSGRVYLKLRRIFLKSVGVDLEAMGHLQPFLILSLVSEAMLQREMPLSLDQYLWELAREKGKERTGIESWDEQIAVAGEMSLEKQLQALRALGRNISKLRKEMRRMTQLYEEENIRMIYQLGKRTLGQMRKPLLYDRNRIMADRIFSLIEKEPWMVAIGAGHLAGAKGVLRLLKQKGVKLTPLKKK